MGLTTYLLLGILLVLVFGGVEVAKRDLTVPSLPRETDWSEDLGRAYLFSLPEVDRNKQIDAIRRRWRDDWTKVKTGR